MSHERDRYHARLDALAATLPLGATVCDVGVSTGHNYRGRFPLQKFVTLDREPKKKPNLVIDLEGPIQPRWSFDVVLCNGVTETCGNPFALVRGVRTLLKEGGQALFGIMLTGYPVGVKADLTRFTPAGAAHLVQTAGLSVEESELCSRDGVPSYAYLLCRG